MNTYEILFVFSSSLSEESLNKALEGIKGDVSRLGGTVKETKVLGKKTFARPMKKVTEGLYVRAIAELEPQSVAELHGRFKLNDAVLRVQVLKQEVAAKGRQEAAEPDTAVPEEKKAAAGAGTDTSAAAKTDTTDAGKTEKQDGEL